MKDAEGIVEREAKQWDMDNIATEDDAPPAKSGGEDAAAAMEQDARSVDTVGAATTNGDAPSSPKISEDTNMKDVDDSNPESEEKDRPAAEPTEAVKDHGDNGEEVVEGEEDTVIY